MDERRLFGEIAIQKGFVSPAQVKQALQIQREMRRSGEGHKLIGVLLVELGYMSPDKVVQVLDTYDAERAAEERKNPQPPIPDATGSDPFVGRSKPA